MIDTHLKLKLYEACLLQVDESIETIQRNLLSIKESRDNETKSSAGDKYETGRAMMQMEYQKTQGQFLRTKNLRLELKSIELNNPTKTIQKGSLVETNNGIYFISIGAGKVKLDQIIYYCVSVDSPIGRRLIGKKPGDSLGFNSTSIIIMKVL